MDIGIDIEGAPTSSLLLIYAAYHEEVRTTATRLAALRDELSDMEARGASSQRALDALAAALAARDVSPQSQDDAVAVVVGHAMRLVPSGTRQAAPARPAPPRPRDEGEAQRPAEQTRQEAPRQEVHRPAPQRQEQPRQEQPRQEQPRQEQPRPDAEQRREVAEARPEPRRVEGRERPEPQRDAEDAPAAPLRPARAVEHRPAPARQDVDQGDVVRPFPGQQQVRREVAEAPQRRLPAVAHAAEPATHRAGVPALVQHGHDGGVQPASLTMFGGADDADEGFSGAHSAFIRRT